MEKWLIAVDLDGTLFHTDHQISARTLKTMHRVVGLGHSIVIVTGRSWHSSVPKLVSIPASSRLLCSNGAYEYDRNEQTVVWSIALSASTSIDLHRRILDTLPAASFGWESANGLTYEQKFIDEAGGVHTMEQGGLQESLGQSDVFKLFVRTPEQKGGELSKSLQKLLGEEIEVSSSGVPFVEITASGINKGTSLARVAADLGFESSQTIAFGDNLNDVTMLHWVGESVAMGNAIPELQEIASAHALSNADDGVARFLETRFPD